MIITKEHQILSALYNLRCLNFNQIYALCFNGCSERSCTNQLSKMVSAKLISKSGYHRDTAYYMLCKRELIIFAKRESCRLTAINKALFMPTPYYQQARLH